MRNGFRLFLLLYGLWRIRA